MASEERLLNEGRLLACEQEAKRLAIKLHGLKEQIRREMDPHRQIAQLDTTKTEVLVTDLVQTDATYEDLLVQIASLREDLGLPRYGSR
jgi:hypothetical protein